MVFGHFAFCRGTVSRPRTVFRNWAVCVQLAFGGWDVVLFEVLWTRRGRGGGKVRLAILGGCSDREEDRRWRDVLRWFGGYDGFVRQHLFRRRCFRRHGLI